MDWPEETVRCDKAPAQWSHAGSNIILDFHGDPLFEYDKKA